MDFHQAIEVERNRIEHLLADLNDKLVMLNSDITRAKQELKALDAYESAKSGTAKKKGQRKTGLSKQVIEVLKTPMKRADIIEALGIKGDKSREQTLSNTLANLKKAGKVSAKDGVYTAQV